MSESLRDQLLKSGLVRKLKSERPAKNGVKQDSRPPRREQGRGEMNLAKAYALRDNAERAERERELRQAEQRAREKKERRQKLAALLAGKAENVADAEIPRHFPHGNKIRRIYVTQAQLPRLNSGELGVVQMGGRYLLVAREVAVAASNIDGQALVLLCDPLAASSEDDIPPDIVW